MKWHNSGHWCGGNHCIYSHRVFWCMPGMCCEEHKSYTCCLQSCTGTARRRLPALCSPPHHVQRGQISHSAVQKALLALLVPVQPWSDTQISLMHSSPPSPQGSPGMVQCKPTWRLLWLSSTWHGWSPWPKWSGMQITRQSCPCWYPFQALFLLGTNTASNILVGLQHCKTSW